MWEGKFTFVITRTIHAVMERDKLDSLLVMTDAFFYVKLTPKSRRYVRFKVYGHLFQFCILPFCLCTSPLIYMNVCKLVVHYL